MPRHVPSRQELIEMLSEVELLTTGSTEELLQRPIEELYRDGDIAAPIFDEVIHVCTHQQYFTQRELETVLRKSENALAPVARRLGTTFQEFIHGSIEARMGIDPSSPNQTEMALSILYTNIQARLMRSILVRQSGVEN